MIVYHRVDTDGVLSYEIAKKKLSEEGYEVIPCGYNYGDSIPEFPGDMEMIIMVDISFQPDIMNYLKNFYGIDRVFWIDHHITAIESSLANGYSDMKGVREVGIAACELCWEFFYPNTTTPHLIQYCGAYDVWNKDRFDWNDVLAIQYGFRNAYGTLIEKIDNDFERLIQDPNIISSLKVQGEAILNYLNRKWKSEVKNYAFEVQVDGKYKGICILGTEFSSNVFGSVLDKYDLYIVVNRKGPNVFNISMYKEPDRVPEFSCGGYRGIIFGHRSAAGGTLNLDQFIDLITNCRI